MFFKSLPLVLKKKWKMIAMAEEKKIATFTTPILVALLVVASFLAGMFWTKVRYLEKEKASEEIVQVTPSPQPPQEEGAGLREEETAKLAEVGPVKGGSDAPVTIVEFSDFQCPACGGAAPAVEQILENFGDQVKLVFRHFPLSFHPYARPAALASLCAEEQGRFWEYHDKIFKNQRELSDAALKKWAEELGLNETKFNICLDEERYKSRVDEDYLLGQEVGVGGTPTFYVNGRMVEWKDQTEGWFNALKRYVDAELTK